VRNRLRRVHLEEPVHRLAKPPLQSCTTSICVRILSQKL
jgi:hypothetical protein